MGQLEIRGYGHTGEEATVLGLGGGSLNKYSYSDGIATVQRALELGVTYFDTAIHYGHGMKNYGTGVSQAILGEALEGSTEEHLLATKVGHFYTPEKFRSHDAIRTQIEDSLRLLRRDTIDVLQIHEADWSWWWDDDSSKDMEAPVDIGLNYAHSPVMEVLRESKASGLCKAIGVTSNRSSKLSQILDMVDVDACLCAYHYNVFNRGVRRDLLPITRTRGTAVILGGIFQCFQWDDDSSDVPLSTPFWNLLDINNSWLKSEESSWMSEEMRARTERLYSLQCKSEFTMLETVMGYMLGDQDITTILIGAGKPSEIEQCVRAAEIGPLPKDLHEAIDALGDCIHAPNVGAGC